MKNLLRIMLLVTAVFAFTSSVSAQQRRGGERISREQLAEKQAKHIAELSERSLGFGTTPKQESEQLYD